MNAITEPSGGWAWPQLQRWLERWLRRWGYALVGLAMGLVGMWLAQPEVGQAYVSALQAQAQLAQQLTDLRSRSAAPAASKGTASNGETVAQAQRLLSHLPVATQPENLWIRWQETLAAHDLRLQFLQPVPSVGTVGHGDDLVSHAAAWRVLGRFDDWARVWAACAERGPVCAIERISVVATNQPGEVQIDAVMRVWMRSAKELSSHEPLQADWMADDRKGAPSSSPLRTALFLPNHAGVADGNTRKSDGLVAPTRTEDPAAAETHGTPLPNDPHQWPLARIRWAGSWQQGSERQAVLSAGTHAVRVTLGQRVSLEGHRVVAISDQGVHLRLGQGPSFQLPWAQVPPVGESLALNAGVSTSPLVESNTSGGTTGSQAK